MISASQLKKGTIFEYQDEPFRVLDYQHTHLGRGSANIRLKIKSLVSGKVLSVNLGAGDRFDEVFLEKKQLKYLYADRESMHLTHEKDDQEFEIEKELLGDNFYFFKKGETLTALFWNDRLIDLVLDPKVTLKVTKAEPAVKGNSATNVFKKVKTETGLEVKVPLFIEEGDQVIINTDTGEYVSRA